MTKKSQILLFVCVALASLRCTHIAVREPASINEIVTNEEARALSDLLGDDSPLNAYRHPLTLQVRTSGDAKYLSEKAKKALGEAITKSLQGEGPTQGLAKAVTTHLKEAFIDNFITTLRFYKLINIGIQVDVTFSPEPNNHRDFAAELSSNQLVRLNEVGKLSEKWKELEKSLTNKLHSNSFYIPTNNSPQNYVGGVLTLYLKILDADPQLKAPNVLKNGVKGFIRYRRFYRLNSASQTIHCENYNSNFRSLSDKAPLFYTVDLYKRINLAQINPEEESIELFPGLIAATGEGREGLLPAPGGKSKDSEYAGRSISTGHLSVQQNDSSTSNTPISLRKIVYTLPDRKISPHRSTINKSASEESGKGLSDYFEKCNSPIETFFKLESLLPGGSL